MPGFQVGGLTSVHQRGREGADHRLKPGAQVSEASQSALRCSSSPTVGFPGLREGQIRPRSYNALSHALPTAT